MTTFRELVAEKLREYATASGVYKIQILITLRTMFRDATLQDQLDAINDCNEIWQLNVLLGVGMRGVLWSALAKRRGVLMGL